MLVGAYDSGGEISRRITDALPVLVVLRTASWESPTLPLVLQEVVRDQPGQQVMLDRMLDALVIDALRAWFDRPESQPPAWYSAFSAPAVGEALHLVHDRPKHPWTIAGLARSCGISRAGLARRVGYGSPFTFSTAFKRGYGQSPSEYRQTA